MIYKETTWEKRNLGVDSCEFYIDRDECSDSIFSEISDCKKEYQVIHIDSGNTEALLKVQRLGFSFIEMNIQVQRNISDYESPSVYKRFEKALSYAYADANQVEMIKRIISSGEMFTTDKVARDPFFGPKAAGYRYSMWLQDVLDKNGKLMLAKYKNEIVGFDVLVDAGDSSVDAFLGGVFPEYANRGLGFSPLYLALLAAREEGYKKMFTGVSSNNVPILRLHEIFGFQVSSMSYCLIKHM